MRRPWGGVLLVVSGLLLALIPAGIFGAVWTWACVDSEEALPSDEELLARFQKYRPELDQLVRMFSG